MKQSPFEFRVGDSVAVKRGVKDPDTGGDISGWQGRVSEFGADEDDSPTIGIAWDSITLKKMPHALIARSEDEGWDWRTMYLALADVVPATARDTEEEVEEALEELESQTAWLFLGKEGARIQAVLNGIDLDDELSQIEAWEAHLEQKLKFPFEAEIKEGDHYRVARVGDRVQVTGLCEADDLYGVQVNAHRGRENCVLPLCDLEATDKRSANYQPLRDYVVWFANR